MGTSFKKILEEMKMNAGLFAQEAGSIARPVKENFRKAIVTEINKMITELTAQKAAIEKGQLEYDILVIRLDAIIKML